LNGRGIARTFSISHRQSGGLSCIPFRQIGTNDGDIHDLGIAAFEVFGERRIRTPIPE
jgi:hypothetical protein